MELFELVKAQLTRIFGDKPGFEAVASQSELSTVLESLPSIAENVNSAIEKVKGENEKQLSNQMEQLLNSITAKLDATAKEQNEKIAAIAKSVGAIKAAAANSTPKPDDIDLSQGKDSSENKTVNGKLFITKDKVLTATKAIPINHF